MILGSKEWKAARREKTSSLTRIDHHCSVKNDRRDAEGGSSRKQYTIECNAMEFRAGLYSDEGGATIVDRSCISYADGNESRSLTLEGAINNRDCSKSKEGGSGSCSDDITIAIRGCGVSFSRSEKIISLALTIEEGDELKISYSSSVGETLTAPLNQAE